MVNSSGTTTYAWDFENRLTSVALPGSGGTVYFKYDPFGRRICFSVSNGGNCGVKASVRMTRSSDGFTNPPAPEPPSYAWRKSVSCVIFSGAWPRVTFLAL